ncbi:MAG: CCDC90 family protein [Magnetococcus sp. THC-1_WYH]
MTAITFDTLKYVKTLKAAGFDEQQAEALAVTQADVLAKNLDDLATKADIKELEGATKANIKELEGKMREFEARVMGEIRLNRWMLALIIIVTVLPALKSLIW